MEFRIEAKFNVSPEVIYKAWLNSKSHSAMTGAPASINDKPGSKFSAWDGYIEGENIELEKNRRIMQSWRTSDFDHHQDDSLLEIERRIVPALPLKNRPQQKRPPDNGNPLPICQRFDSHRSRIAVGAGKFKPEFEGALLGIFKSSRFGFGWKCCNVDQLRFTSPPMIGMETHDHPRPLPDSASPRRPHRKSTGLFPIIPLPRQGISAKVASLFRGPKRPTSERSYVERRPYRNGGHRG